MYRVYLRTFDQRVDLASKTNTRDSAVAVAAFAALVNRTDLDGQKIAAVLSHDGGQLAFHRFDRHPGQPDYWRGRLDDIDLPGNPVGAPRQLDGGKRVNVYLDAASLARAAELGDGNVSEGIRIALLRDTKEAAV